MLLLVSHLHFRVTSLFHTDAMVLYYSSETHRTRLRLRLKDSKFGHKDDDAERLQHWGRLCDKYPHMRGAFKPDLSVNLVSASITFMTPYQNQLENHTWRLKF